MKIKLGISVIIFCLGSNTCVAEDFKTERQLLSLYKSLWSPFCPGRSLADCPSGDADKLKDEIRKLFLQGKGKDEIVREINRSYNDEILAYPDRWPHSFFSVVPVIIFGLVLAVVVLVFGKKLFKNANG